MPTVNRMEIEGTMHDIEDTTARESVTGIDSRLTTAETTIETLSEAVENLNTTGIFTLPASAANTNIVIFSSGFTPKVITVGNLQILTGAVAFKEQGAKVNVRVFTLPEGYHPKWVVEGSAYMSSGNLSSRFWIDQNGNAYMSNSNSNIGGYMFILAVYPKA